MAEYRFIEGPLPFEYKYNFDSYLFNRAEYRLIQAKDKWASFYILDDHRSTVEAQVHFYCDGFAKSGFQAPFGGIEFSESIKRESLLPFMEFVCSALKERGLTSISITNPPQAYEPASQTLSENCLAALRFDKAKSEITSLVTISDKPFSSHINTGKKWMLKQTLGTGLLFQELGIDSVTEVYKFIHHHRMRKGYQLSITLEHLKHSVNALPEFYHLFGVFNEGELVGASVAVRVSKKILYHFISDHERKIDVARPALILMQGIYDFCRKENIELLDLGTSMNGTVPNLSLIKYKSEIGGQSSDKFTFVKSLL